MKISITVEDQSKSQLFNISVALEAPTSCLIQLSTLKTV